MNVFFFTLGCKVNQYETVILKNILLKNNFNISELPEYSEIFIINSCTVTSSSDKKINKIINKIKNINENAIIVLIGCFPQAFPEKSEIFNKVNIVLGNTNKFEIDKFLKEYEKSKTKIIKIENHEIKSEFSKFKIEKVFKTPRAFIQIQDGCNRFCSYCIIPKARGFIKSKTIEQIKTEVMAVTENGCCEIVLVGINLSCYGQDLKNINLVDVVSAISLIDGVKRIRLSSLEPNILTKEDILNLKENEKFCPHFHFSLQSGSDNILKNMNRHYNKELYLKTIEFIRKVFNNPAITTDIIVGFPGETEKDFKESLDFIEKIKFSKVHIFPYSKREGTKAATMPNQIPEKEKKLRFKIMNEVAKKTNKEFLKSQQGKKLNVLFETEKEKIFSGYSKNYARVQVFSNHNLSGKIKNVKINEVEKNFLKGVILN